MSRIDWFLVSKDWEIIFSSGMAQVAFARVLSDDRPIKLSPTGVNWGPKPFRFKKFWLANVGRGFK